MPIAVLSSFLFQFLWVRGELGVGAGVWAQAGARVLIGLSRILLAKQSLQK